MIQARVCGFGNTRKYPMHIKTLRMFQPDFRNNNNNKIVKCIAQMYRYKNA